MIAALFVFDKNRTKKTNLEKDSEYSDETIENPMPQNTNTTSSDVTLSPASSGDATPAVRSVAPVQQMSPEQLQRFMFHVEQMENCLRLPKGGVAGLSKASSTELIEALKPQLGEVIVSLDDWEQFDLIDKSGVKKRIRVDFEYPDGATPTRRLSIFTVNDYGALEIDNLTNDQADNPNIAYIESLKEGVQITADEKSMRVYFNQGEELIVTTKNGLIDSFSMSRADRSYNCVNMLSESSNCTCP